MRANALRHSGNGSVRLCGVDDTRAPHVERLVHYRRTTSENTRGVRPGAFTVDTGLDAAFRPHLPRTAAAPVKTDFLTLNQALDFASTACTTLL